MVIKNEPMFSLDEFQCVIMKPKICSIIGDLTKIQNKKKTEECKFKSFLTNLQLPLSVRVSHLGCCRSLSFYWCCYLHGFQLDV